MFNFNLSVDSPLYFLFSVHCLIGIFAAVIAQYKGYSLARWLVYGLIGGTFVLVLSCLVPQKN